MRRPRRAPCLHCRYKTKTKQVTPRWAPFCSQRCAAEHAIQNEMDAYWCPVCEAWSEGDCFDHPDQSLHAGLVATVDSVE